MLIQALLEGLEDTPRFVPLGWDELEIRGQLPLPGFEHRRTVRPLYQPNESMRLLQRRLLVMLQMGYITPREESVMRALNLAVTSRHRYLYHVDLRRAYLSVSIPELATSLYRRYRSLYPTERTWLDHAREDEILEMLERFCMAPEGGLVQGGAASPYLFHFEMQRRFYLPFVHAQYRSYDPQTKIVTGSWSYDHDLWYGRYTDGFFFSSFMPIGKVKRAQINEVIRGAGYAVNTQKTRLYDLDRGPVVLSGVGLRRTRRTTRTFMPRDKLGRLEGLLHLAKLGREHNPCQLQGLMAYFRMVTSKTGYNATERRIVTAYEALPPRPRSRSRMGPMLWPEAVSIYLGGWQPGPNLEYLLSDPTFL